MCPLDIAFEIRAKKQGLSWAGAGGPAQPIKFSSYGWRPGPTHQFFRGWAAARSSLSHFQIFTARPMTLAARPMRHGLYTGRPAHFRGPARGFLQRAGPRDGPCVVPYKGDAYAFMCFLLYFFSRFLLRFLGPAHEPHTPTNHTIWPHQRPAPMASVPTGGLPPTSFCCCDARSSSSSSSSICCCNTCNLLVQNRLLQHLLLSSERNKEILIDWQGLVMLQQQSSFPARQ